MAPSKGGLTGIYTTSDPPSRNKRKMEKSLSKRGESGGSDLLTRSCRFCGAVLSAPRKVWCREACRARWKKTQPAYQVIARRAASRWRVSHPDQVARNYWRKGLRARYGLSIADFDRIIQEQGGLCAICHTPLKQPHVDHNHQTGTVRALLCGGCNTGLGGFRDSPFNLRAAIDYLEKHSGR